MSAAPMGTALRQIGRLLGLGTAAGLSEGQLLRRFVERRDEVAFEALVARHGPMVLGLCRRLLPDPHDADDAFQATFLVLVQKAHAIREPDLLANWLYGVAHKVAARSRSQARKRAEVESKGAAERGSGMADLDDFDLRAAIHHEVNRLPENYKRPVVLCHLEGRSMEDAATLLGWPIGTVKGRLHRAKELLKGRLSRRGLAIAPASLAACLSADAATAVPPLLLDATVNASMALGAGSAIVAGLGTSGALQLADGVTRAMLATKLKVLLAVGVSTMGLAAGGAGVYGLQDGAAAKGQPTPSKSGEPISTIPDEPQPAGARRPNDPAWADDPVGTMKAFYENGTITIDRYLDISRRVMLAKLAPTKDRAARVAIVEDYIKQLEEIGKRQAAKVEDGTGNLPDFAEAKLNLVEARAMLKAEMAGDRQPADVADPIKPASPADRPLSRTGLDEVESARKRLVDVRLAGLRKNFADRLARGLVDTNTGSIEVGSPRHYFGRLRDLGVSPAEMIADLTAYRDGLKKIREALAVEGRDNPQSTAYRLGLFDDSILVAELWLAQARRGQVPDIDDAEGSKGRVTGKGPGEKEASPPPVASARAPMPPITRPNPDADRNKAIAEALEMVIPMDFPEPTELTKVVDHIRKSTIGPLLPKGIPVYIDPSIRTGGPNGEVMPVTIKLDDARLRTSLRLMLGSVNLGYNVDEGLLIISSVGSSLLNPTFQGPMGGGGFGGGMGGMGGGMR